jgi:apolipoprotein N-acyltransferase
MYQVQPRPLSPQQTIKLADRSKGQFRFGISCTGLGAVLAGYTWLAAILKTGAPTHVFSATLSVAIIAVAIGSFSFGLSAYTRNAIAVNPLLQAAEETIARDKK